MVLYFIAKSPTYSEIKKEDKTKYDSTNETFKPIKSSNMKERVSYLATLH